MDITSNGGEGDEQVSADFSGFLQVEEEESGPGVSGMPETQDPTGTELPSGVPVLTGTQKSQKVPVKKGSEKRGAEGFGVAGLPAAWGLYGPPGERTHPEGLKGSDVGVSAFAEAQLTASETQDGMEVDDEGQHVDETLGEQQDYVLTADQRRRIRKRQRRRMRDKENRLLIASQRAVITQADPTQEGGQGEGTVVAASQAGASGGGAIGSADPTAPVWGGAAAGADPPEDPPEEDAGRVKRPKYSTVAGKGWDLRVLTPDGGRPSEEDLREMEDAVVGSTADEACDSFRVENIHLTQWHIIIIADDEKTMNWCQGVVREMKQGDGSPRFIVLMPGEDPPMARFTITVPKRQVPNEDKLRQLLDVGNQQDEIRVDEMRIFQGWDNNEPEKDRTRTYVLGLNPAQVRVLEGLGHMLYCGARRREVQPYRRRACPKVWRSDNERGVWRDLWGSGPVYTLYDWGKHWWANDLALQSWMEHCVCPNTEFSDDQGICPERPFPCAQWIVLGRGDCNVGR